MTFARCAIALNSDIFANLKARKVHQISAANRCRNFQRWPLYCPFTKIGHLAKAHEGRRRTNSPCVFFPYRHSQGHPSTSSDSHAGNAEQSSFPMGE